MNVNYLKHEREFIVKCQELRLRLMKDEDFCPILRPRGKLRKKLYKICSWGPDKCDITITTNHPKTKKRIINMMECTKVPFEIKQNGDREAILVFSITELKKVAKKFGCIKSVDKKLLKKPK